MPWILSDNTDSGNLVVPWTQKKRNDRPESYGRVTAFCQQVLDLQGYCIFRCCDRFVKRDDGMDTHE